MDGDYGLHSEVPAEFRCDGSSACDLWHALVELMPTVFLDFLYLIESSSSVLPLCNQKENTVPGYHLS